MNRIILLAIFFIFVLLSACEKIQNSPPYSEKQVKQLLTSWYSIKKGGPYKVFSSVGLKELQVDIIDKGELTEKKEIPIKVKFSGVEYDSIYDLDAYRAGNGGYQHIKKPLVFEKVFYVSKNDFKKIRIYSEDHDSWIQEN